LAPEFGIGRVLREFAGAGYVSGDFQAGRAMVQLDLTRIPFGDGEFDLIFVSHVLEHIPDDARAIAEMYRCLVPGGIAFVEVPVQCRATYEDPTLTEPQAREREFGQFDHVRLCGLDYPDRLRRAGFQVEELESSRQFGEREQRAMRLLTHLPTQERSQLPPRFEKVHEVRWICTKPAVIER
jgi:SAM-dependent methyltransferase